jgi:hypothetical protein
VGGVTSDIDLLHLMQHAHRVRSGRRGSSNVRYYDWLSLWATVTPDYSWSCDGLASLYLFPAIELWK